MEYNGLGIFGPTSTSEGADYPQTVGIQPTAHVIANKGIFIFVQNKVILALISLTMLCSLFVGNHKARWTPSNALTRAEAISLFLSLRASALFYLFGMRPPAVLIFLWTGVARRGGGLLFRK